MSRVGVIQDKIELLIKDVFKEEYQISGVNKLT